MKSPRNSGQLFTLLGHGKSFEPEAKSKLDVTVDENNVSGTDDFEDDIDGKLFVM